MEKKRNVRIDSVGIFVEDLEIMVAFYRDVMGFPMKWDGKGPFAECRSGSIHFMLYERKELPGYMGREVYYPEGLNGSFEIAVDLPHYHDVDREFRRIVNMGAVPIVEPRDEPWGMRTSFVADPEDNLVEIGSWNKRSVEVLPYMEKWQADFELESKLLAVILEEELINIHHIGSTSVPGLAAKPIIDIIVVVKNIKEIDNYNKKMKGIGYKAMGEYGISGRRFFRKGHPARTHHVHIYNNGNDNIPRHLAFREYLIANEHIRDEYETLKMKYAEICENDINKYCELKEEFIQEQEVLALEWYKDKSRIKEIEK